MTVVIGFVPDEFGEAALAYGIGEAQRRESRLVIVNSTKGDALVDPHYLGQDDRVTLEEQLAASGVEHEVRQTTGKDIADEILGVAKEVGAKVVVIGIRHRTPVGKLIMGSVAQRVIIDAPCPVVAVKPG